MLSPLESRVPPLGRGYKNIVEEYLVVDFKTFRHLLNDRSPREQLYLLIMIDENIVDANMSKAKASKAKGKTIEET